MMVDLPRHPLCDILYKPRYQDVESFFKRPALEKKLILLYIILIILEIPNRSHTDKYY